MSYALELVTGKKGGGGKGGGGGSSRVAQEAPNTLQSKATLRALEILSAGEIEGPANGTWAQSIFFDDTPLQNPDGTYNFNGITLETRAGTPDQDVINGFANIAAEEAVGVKVTTSTPVVRTITDTDLDAVVVTIRLPALTSQDTTNGDLNGSQVALAISYQPNGGSYIQYIGDTITGKTTSPYERQYRINLTGSAPWNIKVERISPESDNVATQNEMYWSSYTKVIDHRLIYPDLALAGLSVDSSLFGSDVPQRSYLIRGIRLQVPSNYDPETRLYDGVWDGTFERAWSNNPAWVLYDLATNDFYGLGHILEAAAMDKWTLYEIAQYCDVMVPDGKGGLEPRFTFNGVLQTQDDALKVLQVVASVYRGMLYAGAEGDSAVVTSTYDAPSDAIKIFQPANVIDGMFTYASSPAESQHSAVYVTWNDPEDNYRAAIEVVHSPRIGQMLTQRQLDVVAYGCTSRGQAHRYGKWILDSELNEDEQVTFSVGLADADTRPGQLVKIFDPSIADVRAGGRVISATTTTVTIDDTFEIEAGQSYTLDVVLPDGTIESRDILNSPGAYSVLTLSSALSDTPAPMTLWAVTSTDLAPRLFRVITVKEVSPIQYEVLAQLHDPTKYARVESDIDLPSTPFTKLPTGALKAPQNPTYTEFFSLSGLAVRSNVSISWSAAKDSRVVGYIVEVTRPGANSPVLTDVGADLSYVVSGTVDGEWGVAIRAYDNAGHYSQRVSISPMQLSINASPPLAPTSFDADIIGNVANLAWSPSESLHAASYQIRYSTLLTGAEWQSSGVLRDNVVDNHSTVPALVGTYLIKTKSQQGVLSSDVIMVSNTISDDNALNAIQDIDEIAPFNSVKDKVMQVDDALRLTFAEDIFGRTDFFAPSDFFLGAEGYVTRGYYYLNEIVNLDASYVSRVTPTLIVKGVNTGVDLFARADFFAQSDFFQVATDDWAIFAEYSATDDNPTDPGAVWSDWRRCGALSDVSGRGIKFRIVFESYEYGVTPELTGIFIKVDMPDRIISDKNLTIMNTGLRVDFLPKYYIYTGLNMTSGNLATGDWLDIVSKDATGFTVFARNAAGVAKSGIIIDYTAVGAGAEQ